MQVGIDSLAAAYDEASLAVNTSDRLRNLVEQIEYADQVGWTSLVSGNTTVGTISIQLLRSFWEPWRHERTADVSPVRSQS